MSKRIAFLASLCLATPLVAQDRVAQLEHRIAVLSQRDAQLSRQLTIRDSLRAERQDLVVIGAAPQFAKVPRWAAASAGPEVDSAVAQWKERLGPLWATLPAETLRVTFREDTAGMDRAQLRMNLQSFPATIVYDVGSQLASRVDHRLGARFGDWTGHQLPGTFARARVDAILALAKDTTPDGAACLEGRSDACAAVMRRPDPPAALIRRSFAAWALEQRGSDGWWRLAQDTLSAPEVRLAALTGHSPEVAVADWLEAVRQAPETAGGSGPGALVGTLVWGAAFLSLALWRIRWRHV